MTFGEAVEALKVGNSVSRTIWNAKNVWVRLQSPDQFSLMTVPYIFMSTSTDDLIPWVASQRDVLAEDWFIVE